MKNLPLPLASHDICIFGKSSKDFKAGVVTSDLSSFYWFLKPGLDYDGVIKGLRVFKSAVMTSAGVQMSPGVKLGKFLS